jgi:biotin carboxyl carrier protein
MLKIKVNKDKNIDYNQENGKIFIQGNEFLLDIKPLGNNRFHLIRNNRCLTAEVIQFDKETKTFKLKINGTVVETQIKDHLDVIMEKMGMTVMEGLKVNEVKAPMPGLILDIKVNEGSSVEVGENLVILEAMKMENIIKSPRKGIIKSVKVKQGQSVDRNQILLEFLPE